MRKLIKQPSPQEYQMHNLIIIAEAFKV